LREDFFAGKAPGNFSEAHTITLETHVTRLSIVYAVVGAIHLIAGGAIAAVHGISVFDFSNDAEISFSAMMLTIASLALITTGAASLLSSWWLSKRVMNGRIVALTSAFLLLIAFPLGTAAGAYGIWVLLQDDAESLFRARS
jgi:hypothetical protein